jgi:hypothetical protein
MTGKLLSSESLGEQQNEEEQEEFKTYHGYCPHKSEDRRQSSPRMSALIKGGYVAGELPGTLWKMGKLLGEKYPPMLSNSHNFKTGICQIRSKLLQM